VDGVGETPGTYKSLASALSESDGDPERKVVITLRVNGPLAVKPLDIGNRKVEIRAAPGFFPELAFRTERVPSAGGEVALFLIDEGSLVLENVGVRVVPLKDEALKVQSLVAITGSGRCALRGCSVTLGGEGGPRLAVVSLADPASAMMGVGSRPTPGEKPAVEIEDCFVRGHGDLVTVRVSRPFDLRARNAVFALAGSVLSIDGHKADNAVPADPALVAFEAVTAYTTQYLIAMRATMTNPLHVPLQVTAATSCVFVAAEGNPHVYVDGVQSEQELKRRLSWQGKGNAYSPTGPVLIWQSLERTDNPHLYDGDQWIELWGRGDEAPSFLRTIKFSGYPAAGKLLADTTPADFAIVSTDPAQPILTNRGADVDRLPRPPRPANEE
jgi:hypothetical protein